MKILNIGLGLAGSRMAIAFTKSQRRHESHSGDVKILNLSEEENEAVLSFNKRYINNIDVFHVGGENIKGSGKNRRASMDQFINHFDKAHFLKTISQDIEEFKYDGITISFGTGGGSGSGMAPVVLKMVKNMVSQVYGDSKFVMGFGLLPSFDEGIMSFKNTVTCIDDIHGKCISSGSSLMYVEYLPTKDEEVVGDTRDRTNTATADAFLHYLTPKFSSKGILDIQDRLRGLTLPGYHCIRNLIGGEIENGPIMNPGNSPTKYICAEVPEQFIEIYESTILGISNGRSVDNKIGYCSSSNRGIIANHGFKVISSVVEIYRVRFEELKSIDESFDNMENSGGLEQISDVEDYTLGTNAKFEAVSVEDAIGNAAGDMEEWGSF